jgi:hypothetical protein
MGRIIKFRNKKADDFGLDVEPRLKKKRYYLFMID